MIAQNNRGRARRSAKRSSQRRDDGMLGWVNRPLRSTTIKRSCTKEVVTSYDGGTLLRGYTFELGDLPNYSEFAIYDQYRIDKITVHILVDSNPVSYQSFNGPSFDTINSKSIGSVPHLVTCIDYDDSTVASLDSILEHQTNVIHGVLAPGKMYSRTFQPRAKVGDAIQTMNWFDTLNGGIDHFGFKMAVVSGSIDAPECRIYVYCDFYLSLRFPV